MAGKRLPEPGDVLAGRASVDLPTLVSLIHRVNPTDRGLGRTETDRRYALKSRLQSLLLRRYPERLTVRWSGEDEVLLDVPIDGRDAGHAKVWALDEDVRPLVRSRADDPGDLEAEGEPEPSVVDPGRGQAARSAEEALAAGDLDGAAEGWLALGRAGDAGAAREGLVVLVDWLGDTARALREHERLPAAVGRQASVRAVLARGLARDGDAEGAEALAAGGDGREVAEAWREIAERRLEARDRIGARRAVDRMTGADPTLRQDALRLGERLRSLEDADRAPLRAAVDAALAAGGDVEPALAMLEQAFPRDPHAATARERLRKAEADARTRTRIEAARRSVELGQWDSAERLLADLDATATAVGELRVAARQGRAEAAVAVVVGKLREDVTTEAITAWLELEPADRARAAHPHAALAAAAELASTFRRRPEVLAAAALRLVRLGDLLDAGREDEVVAELGALGDLALAARPGRAAAEELRRRDTARAATASRAQLERARAALSDDPAAALADLDRVTDRHLDERERAELATLREVARRASEERARRTRFQLALRSSEPWRAAALADTPEDRGLADAAVRAAIPRVEIEPVPPGPLVSTSMVGARGHPLRVLEPDGRAAVLVEALGTTLVLHRVTIPELTPVRTVLLRLPLALYEVEPVLLGEELWIAVDNGFVLAADAHTFEPRRWTRLSVAGGAVEVGEGTISHRDRVAHGEGGWRTTDARSLLPSDTRDAGPRHGVPGIRGAFTLSGSRCARIDPAGRIHPYAVIDLPHTWSGVALDPRDPEGLVIEIHVVGNGSARRDEVWRVGRTASRILSLPTGWMGCLASDPGRRLLFLARPHQETFQVRATDADGRPLWEARAPGVSSWLLQSAAGGPVGVLCLAEGGPAFRWLGAEAPDLPAPEGMGPVARLDHERSCDGRALSRPVPIDLANAVAEAPDADAFARTATREGTWPREVLWRALLDAGHYPAKDLFDALPGELAWALVVYKAEVLARAREWPAVRSLLSSAALPDPLGGHAYHLLGHAAYVSMLGGHMEDLARTPTTCDRSGLKALIRPTDLAKDATVAHIRTCEAVDEALAAGDLAAARAALDTAAAWTSGDIQAAGRRLRALREGPPVSVLDVLRARAAFDQCRGDAPSLAPWTTAELVAERGHSDALLAGTPFAP